eukprot:TRINITY_DN144_c0_g1_i4.p1 TRINITY_DN144_c0_g1~~TRINITY_DN144_c0_g1_i4.p1  ORF type:complete len:724 (-),score=135.02 TRINITY_DN144_c0_g1_i4:162-2333(-)
MSMIIKLVYNKAVHRLRFSHQDLQSFTVVELRRLVRSTFTDLVPLADEQIHFHYVDDEADQVSLLSEADLKEAITFAINKPVTLRIVVVPKKEREHGRGHGHHHGSGARCGERAEAREARQRARDQSLAIDIDLPGSNIVQLVSYLRGLLLNPDAKPKVDEIMHETIAKLKQLADELDGASRPQPRHAADDVDASIHFGVSCDGCGSAPIVGLRFKCQDCEDYDLCTVCREGLGAEVAHPETHSFVQVEPLPPIRRLHGLGRCLASKIRPHFHSQTEQQTPSQPMRGACRRRRNQAQGFSAPSAQTLATATAPTQECEYVSVSESGSESISVSISESVSGSGYVSVSSDKIGVDVSVEVNGKKAEVVVAPTGNGDDAGDEQQVRKQESVQEPETVKKEEKAPTMYSMPVSQARPAPISTELKASVVGECPKLRIYSGAVFSAEWRVVNDGEVAWPTGTTLAWVGGDDIEAFGGVQGLSTRKGAGRRDGRQSTEDSSDLGASQEASEEYEPRRICVVPPALVGQELRINASFVAPTAPGDYTPYFRLLAPSGTRFGTRLYFALSVLGHISPSTPTSASAPAPTSTQSPFRQTQVQTQAQTQVQTQAQTQAQGPTILPPSNPFGGPTPSVNPFGGPTPSVNPFGGPTPLANPFGGPTPSAHPFEAAFSPRAAPIPKATFPRPTTMPHGQYWDDAMTLLEMGYPDFDYNYNIMLRYRTIDRALDNM